MSADNGIYVLMTVDSHKKEGQSSWINTFGKGIVTYRVAHAQAIDNLLWYEDNQAYNVGYYLNQIWGNSPVFYEKSEALAFANEMANNCDTLEYGVSVIDRPEYKFPF